MSVLINASTSSGLQITSDTSGAIQFQSNGTSTAIINSSGNVGIGTSTPATKFNVVGATGVTFRIEENTSGSNHRGDFSANSATVAIGSKSNTPFVINTNDTERARIDSSGYMQGTVNGLSAGRIPAMQYYRLNSNLAGANVNTAQSVFGVGVTLVGSTQYAFEANYIFAKTAGTTSHTHGLGFGGTATINNILYTFSSASVGSALPILETTPQTGAVNTASNTTVTTSSTGATTSRSITIRGTVSINSGGTFIPQYTLSAAPGGAYSTVAGSYFAIYPLEASGSNINIGSWA